MKAHKWATILSEEKQNADVDSATAHTRTHTPTSTNKTKDWIKRKNKSVPMVVKRLYNRDDMHMFAVPKKITIITITCRQKPNTFLGEATDASAPPSLHWFRFTFPHVVVGHWRSHDSLPACLSRQIDTLCCSHKKKNKKKNLNQIK